MRVVDRQFLEVAKRGAVALAVREPTNRVENTLVFLRLNEPIRDRVGDVHVAADGGVVAQRHEAASVVVAGEVQHDGA